MVVLEKEDAQFNGVSTAVLNVCEEVSVISGLKHPTRVKGRDMVQILSLDEQELCVCKVLIFASIQERVNGDSGS